MRNPPLKIEKDMSYSDALTLALRHTYKALNLIKSKRTSVLSDLIRNKLNRWFDGANQAGARRREYVEGSSEDDIKLIVIGLWIYADTQREILKIVDSEEQFDSIYAEVMECEQAIKVLTSHLQNQGSM